MSTQLTMEPIWPTLINMQHLVSERDMRRHHGNEIGCRIWAYAVARNQRVRVNGAEWVTYTHYLRMLANEQPTT